MAFDHIKVNYSIVVHAGTSTTQYIYYFINFSLRKTGREYQLYLNQHFNRFSRSTSSSVRVWLVKPQRCLTTFRATLLTWLSVLRWSEREHFPLRANAWTPAIGRRRTTSCSSSSLNTRVFISLLHFLCSVIWFVKISRLSIQCLRDVQPQTQQRSAAEVPRSFIRA